MASQILKPGREAFFKAPRQFKRRGVNGSPIGPRTERRAKENKKLGKHKINYCEIRILFVCVGNIMLSWAHSRKSRFLTTGKDWQEAARCCLPCHQYIEGLPHSEMRRRVREAIARRKDSRKEPSVPDGNEEHLAAPRKPK